MISSTSTVDVKADFGAVGDGNTNDSPAIQNAIDSVTSAGAGTVHFPVGTYALAQPLNLVGVTGVNFSGNGGDKTTLYSTGAFPAVQFNGAWRCFFQGLRFQAGASNPGAGVVELDGNYDGYHKMGVQGNTFQRCYFDGAMLADYAFCMTRRGSDNAQGSENIFLNCNFDAGLKACYRQDGFNALNNTLIGGNFQFYPVDGIRLNRGSINLFSVGFQGDHGYQQVINGGWDINATAGGAHDEIVISGCRTESLRFFAGNFAQHARIRGISWFPSAINWSPGQAVPLNAVVFGNASPGRNRTYVATTAGTTGANAPVWPVEGTVNDGSVIWTQKNIQFVNIPSGSISDLTCSYTIPGSAIYVQSSQYPCANIATDYTASYFDEIIAVDTSGGNRTVMLPSWLPHGKRFTVKKTDSSPNTLTVICDGYGLDGVEYTVIPGGSPGYINCFYDLYQNIFYSTGKSF